MNLWPEELCDVFILSVLTPLFCNIRDVTAQDQRVIDDLSGGCEGKRQPTLAGRSVSHRHMRRAQREAEGPVTL